MLRGCYWIVNEDKFWNAEACDYLRAIGDQVEVVYAGVAFSLVWTCDTANLNELAFTQEYEGWRLCPTYDGHLMHQNPSLIPEELLREIWHNIDINDWRYL